MKDIASSRDKELTMAVSRTHPVAAPHPYTTQAHIDHLLREGRPARTFAERRAEREVCYADHLKMIIEEFREIDD